MNSSWRTAAGRTSPRRTGGRSCSRAACCGRNRAPPRRRKCRTPSRKTMGHLIAEGAAVAATWLVLALVFVGLGGGLRRLYGLEDWAVADVFTAFWLGWGA